MHSRTRKITMLLLLAAQSVSSQTERHNLSIAPWAGNRKAAVSVSFDDCIPSQFKYALPVLDASTRQIKTTFFLTANNIRANLEGVTRAHQNGHELANHSTSHPNFNKLSDAEIRKELLNCQDTIKHFVNQAGSFTMAYPYGFGGGNSDKDTSIRRVVSKHFIGARATQIKSTAYNEYFWEKPFVSESYYKINSPMITNAYSTETFANDLDETIRIGGWYAPTYHGIEEGWVITNRNLFESQMDELIKRKENLWIAPFGDVIAYHRERNSAKFEIQKETRRKLHLLLKDTLDNTAGFNIPLTLLIDGNVPVKSITQHGKKIVWQQDGESTRFSAVPDSGTIIIKKRKRLQATSVREQ